MPFFGPYIERFVDAAPGLTIPLWQVLLYVLIISLSALYEGYRVILIFSYVFMVYWVFVENGELMSFNFVWMITGFVFLVFGLVAVMLTLYYMLTGKER